MMQLRHIHVGDILYTLDTFCGAMNAFELAELEVLGKKGSQAFISCRLLFSMSLLGLTHFDDGQTVIRLPQITHVYKTPQEAVEAYLKECRAASELLPVGITDMTLRAKAMAKPRKPVLPTLATHGKFHLCQEKL